MTSQPVGIEYQQQTVAEAVDRAKTMSVSSGIAHILNRSDIFDSHQRAHFLGRATYETAEQLAWDKNVGTELIVGTLKCMEEPHEWANSIVDLGESLSGHPDFNERGRTVLKHAADVFEAAYKRTDDHEQPLFPQMPFSQRRDFVMDYARLADSQDEAGDKEGAKETAITVAPRLIQLAGEIGQDDDGITSQLDALDQRLSLTISHIGSLETPLAKKLFKSIKGEYWRDLQTRVLAESYAQDLLAVGLVTDALKILKTRNLEPLELWSEAAELWEAGEDETVQRFITEVASTYSGYYDRHSDAAAYMTPMMQVLTVVGRDAMLRRQFIAEEQARGQLKGVMDFALWCGSSGERERLEVILGDMRMSDEHKKPIMAMFQKGHEYAQAVANATPEAESS